MIVAEQQTNSDHCRPFHLALPVQNLEQTKAFYTEILGCSLGRTTETWIDLDFFGHQVSFHHSDLHAPSPITNTVDSKEVPLPHLGVILTMERWKELASELSLKGVKFMIEPYIRFAGENGEQATMFFPDPCGYHIEFKAFADDEMIFQRSPT